ncbi:uroporphyrinogen-III C-methyltransferase [Oceanobacillus massiliensis]|uniref:uroporphyrinogen-III C-methyltransferase n=1 Tax=Oceanobacillus massiliensis TaxID=1465765 RepID=UPI00028A243C|nr:uroporphyrinogen-III C-methyltransferase [Oceanobacillus massiliensis]
MGKVYLVGAGPGDPELITVKGLRAIQQSDVILYDRLIPEELLAYAPKEAELLYCGKQPDHHSLTQEKINQLLCEYAEQDKVVTRLKGGDPFIFGRGGEEAEVLKQKGISYEIVPGITSGSAAPAYAGIPLTHRDYSSSVTFVSGVSKSGEAYEKYWEHLAQSSDTLCIYMGVKSLKGICERLVRYGRDKDTPIAVIHWGTTDQQHTVTGTLVSILHQTHLFQNPSMIIIGEVVRLRDRIQWFEKEDLENQLSAEAIFG